MRQNSKGALHCIVLEEEENKKEHNGYTLFTMLLLRTPAGLMKILSLNFLLLAFCHAFLPNNFHSDYGTKTTDFTHKSITEKAVHKASAQYIVRYLKPGVNYNGTNEMEIIQDFFGQDTASRKQYEAAVEKIVYGNNNAQGQHGHDATLSMNAEQIEKGNIHLQNKRDTIIKVAKSPRPDWNFVQLAIGEYLMTLQMFYSNTNWVELKGIQVNTALGIKGQTMLPVAPPSMTTCNDCNYTTQAILHGSCDHNLVNNGEYLTSGYKSNQHTIKPQGLWLDSAGKCSHGGALDDTQSIPARGGINKETSDPNLSPHYRLHQQAGQAAIEATIYFLVGSGTGLSDQMGPALFGDMLNLHASCYSCLDPKLSITFVIDNTGSMSGDIIEVRRKSIDIVDQAIFSGVANYVLSTFNDPVDDNNVRTTTNGTVMKHWLQNLVANGGGDCPEYAMHGLLDGIQQSLPGSCVFFFTDADPKDPELESQVIKAVNDKNIHLLLFLRGQCNGDIQGDDSKNLACLQRKDHLNVGSKRSLFGGSPWGMFSNLVTATSASAIKVSNTEIAETIGDIIDNSVGINSIYIADVTMDNVMKSLKFPIDDHMKLFTIEAKGVYQSDITLKRPDGTIETFSSDTTSVDNIGVAIVLSIKTPIIGTWELQNTAGLSFEVIVKGKGKIEFTSQLLEKVGGIPFPISGSSPIAGSNITIGLTVTDIDENDNVETIILRSNTDVVLKKRDFTSHDKKSPRIMSADFEVPMEPFRITIEGTDKDGNKFRRTSKEMITPVTGNINILPLADDLTRGIPTYVYVKVTNTGSGSQTFSVVASDTQNYLLIPKLRTLTLSPNNSTIVSFQLNGTRKLSITDLTVELQMGYKTLQKATKSIIVKDSDPPVFTTITKSNVCLETIMNHPNCSLGTWFTEVKVTCTQPCVQFYIPSSQAVLTHDALNRTGNITVNIIGSCCSANVNLVAVDSASNIVELPIDFSGGHKIPSSTNIPVQPTTAVGKASGSCVNDCRGLPDGVHQSCLGCTMYVTCSNGLHYDRPCPPGLIFDANIKRCLFTSSSCP